ncbi:Protein SCAR3 [Striga hermonthica]|uniref:Protein SCAR n=1 Tax=Striga hermonthica TaxID=68872 RepID=A0A9N7R3E0_STRHE|nr:Protein SCAR3 [Striga hermonthica]
MPLVRAEVRNEYALGAPELYREVMNKEDPKEVLQGVAVAGLVGVLRQLGDLAEFAAEIFHSLQEEVTRTSSRSHKLMARVKRIETSLSPLEKALLAQRSHLHFAYTLGSNCHPYIPCEQNHFIYSDMPQFIMDSYEDSRGPPCLHLLDKFDPAGPGSCLKRYSDPTFFRRASEASGDAICYKTSKDKKGRKIKKRSWTRSQGVSRDASFAYSSGRIRFTQTTIDGHSSSSQTASTYDATQRSDLNEQTTSTLKNASDHAEGYFHPTNSVKPEEQESTKSISSPVKKQESDFLDYNFLDEKITDAYDDIWNCPFRETAGFSSSSGTWNEKNKNNNIYDDRSMERKTQNRENDGMTPSNIHIRHGESFSPVLNHEYLGSKADDIEISMNSEPRNHVVRTSESADAPADDIESETDQFMDALNTIESECETDTDCTKMKLVEHYPELEDKALKEEVGEVVRHNLECQSSSSRTDILAESSLINGICDNSLISPSPKSHPPTKLEADEFNSVSLVDMDVQSSEMGRGSLHPVSPQSVDSHENESSNAGNILESVLCTDMDVQSSQMGRGSLHPGSLQSVDAHENESSNAGNILESVSYTVSSNIMDDLPEMEISNNSQEHVSETSNVMPVTFWTNGGLLGLQPSKPPDFSMLSSRQGLVVEKEGNIGSSTQHVIDSDKAASQTEIFKRIENNPSMDSSTSHDNQGSGPSVTKTLWKIPPADLDIKSGKLCGPIHQNNNADIRIGSTVTSSQMFEPSNTWLSTGANNKLLLGENRKNSPAIHHNTNAFEQKNRLPVANRTFCGQNKELFSSKRSISSPSSSPPLAHMKISFQPIDGFETLKLKLKFPDASAENGGNTFPSFQLVPEVSISCQNFGSDSDVDTFYRSSPALSDDSLSNRWSESNSENWESSESPTEKDCNIYDALRRISVSTVLDKKHEEFPFVENVLGNTGCCHSFDHRTFGPINDSLGKELKNDVLSPKGVVGPQQFVVMPAPPPPPPVQWEKSEESANGSHYEFGHSHLANTVSQRKPAPFSEDPTDTMHMRKNKAVASDGDDDGNWSET